jgi:hypothetical protein
MIVDVSALIEITRDLVRILEGLTPALGSRPDLLTLLESARRRLDTLRYVEPYTPPEEPLAPEEP